MRRFVLLSAVAAGLGLSSLSALPPALAEPPVPLDESPMAAAVAGPVTVPPVSATQSALTAGIAPAATETAASSTAALDLALKPKPPAPPAVVARINLSTQRMDVTINDVSQHSWAVSSGRTGFASPRGTWRVQWIEKMHYSRKYDNAPMPHAVFFTGGVAVHATGATGMLGRPASHGCIRLAPGNAAQFYALVQKYGTKQTQIQVFGSPPGNAVTARRDRDQDEDVVRNSRGERRRMTSRRMASLDNERGRDRPDSFVQNGIRYVRVR